MPRLVVLTTSPRVAPGVLSWPAWEALRGGVVCVRNDDHPQLPALAEAGIEAEVVMGDSGDDLAGQLLERARAEDVVWLAGLDGDQDLIRELRSRLTESSPEFVLEVVEGSPDPPGARLLDLVTTMDRLRRGCPWDREQTHASLVRYLLEESYEVAETIENGDLAGLRDELGDVLLQVVFHARIAEERSGETAFDIDSVAESLVDKLVRRHPHVFGDIEVSGPEEVESNWEAIKKAERGDAEPLTSGVPLAQPALSLLAALQRRAIRAGMPEDLLAPEGDDLIAELVSLVGRARRHGIDPEAGLREAARRFRRRLETVERAANADGVDITSLTLDEWRKRWRSASA